MFKRFVTITVVCLTLVAAGVLALNWQYAKDWYVVQTTDVQPAAAALGDKLLLTSGADFLYEASQPEVLAADSFNQACSNVGREQSIVLGCYTKKRVYVYNVSDPQLTGVQEVTAAHELLHAVYDRMSGTERAEIDAELERVAATITDAQFAETVAEYQRTESGQVANELHSMLGTEYATLSPKLEKHYAQYFTNRQQIVAYSTQYQAAFKQIDEKRQAYETQRQALSAEIDQLKAEIDSLQTQLENTQDELTSLRRSDVAAYNAAVPEYNALVAKYNATVETVKQKIDAYNQIIEQENKLGTAITELNQKLDSNYQTK